MGEKLLGQLGVGLDIGGQLGRGLSAQKRAEQNAAIDRADADVLLEEGRRRAFEIQRRGREGAATEKVKTAAAGFTQQGTSLDLQLDHIEAAEFNAKEELRVSQAGAKRLRDSAANNVQRGKVAKRSALLGILGTGVSTLGRKRSRKEALDAFN